MPRSLWLELTPHCNLKCLFCYNDWREEPAASYVQPISFNSLCAALERLFSVAKFDYIGLSGGEPLLYRSLKPLVEFLFRREQSTVLTTNGVHANAQRLGELRSAGLTAVQVPVLGTDPRLHDHLSGGPAWRSAIAALVLAKELGFDTAGTFVATAQNFRNMPAVVKMLGSLGVSNIVISGIQLVGSAASHASDLAISGVLAQEYEGLYMESKSVAETYGITMQRSPSVHHELEAHSQSPSWRRFVVTPDGCLKLCTQSVTTLGRVMDITQDVLTEWFEDLERGRLSSFAGSVDKCTCFEHLTTQP